MGAPIPSLPLRYSCGEFVRCGEVRPLQHPRLNEVDRQDEVIPSGGLLVRSELPQLVSARLALEEARR